MKKVISLVLVMALMLTLLTSCGGAKVAGKYVSEEDETNYFNFVDDTKVEACKLGVIMEGEYVINEEENNVHMTFYMEVLGAKVPVEQDLTINEEGNLVESILDVETVYVKQ